MQMDAGNVQCQPTNGNLWPTNGQATRHEVAGGLMLKCRSTDIGWWIMLSLWTRFLALGLLLAQLTACGLKGDLYIPERQYPQQPQQKTSAS